MPDNLGGKNRESRSGVISEAVNGKLTCDQAARMLNLSVRQVKRLKKTFRQNGEASLLHGLTGKYGNHHIKLNEKEKILNLVKEKYNDFGPLFATEKLKENHGFVVNPETLRQWMIKENIWKVKKQRQVKYFSFRQRKEYFGELQQFDGSYHKWFEDRLLDGNGNPLEVCLLAAIDDATSQITGAVFALNEGVIPVFSFWMQYMKINGKPVAIYLDKYSTYKINHKNAVDNFELLTQFEKAMNYLEIKSIKANTPQAKGRIERLFETLQDRLVKELRLAKIDSIEEANEFLKIFIPKFNLNFGVIPAKTGNLHLKLTRKEKISLRGIFSVKSIRVINNDFTIQFKNKYYQLSEIQPTTIWPKDKIEIQEWLNGKIKFVIKEKYLKYSILPSKPLKLKTTPLILTRHKTDWVPPPDHPWRKLRV